MATKNGDYIVDKVSGCLVKAGAEEVKATQPLLEILIQECGWDPKQLVTRPQWRVPSSPSGRRTWPVDVAIFRDAKKARDPDHIVAICECKRPDEESGIAQLKIYLDREPHARVGVWFNGVDHAVIYKTAARYEVAPAGTPIPTPQDPLTPTGKKALTLGDLRQAPSLVPVFKRIRDRLATLDRNVNRDEEILPDISLLLRKLPHPVDSVELDSPARNGRGHEEVEVHGIADRRGPEGRGGRSSGRRADA